MSGDVVVDPFFGTGTTGAVAKMLGRNFIGIERDAHYVAGAQKRIDNTQRVNDDCLEFSSKKRQPRVPFGAVVERGLLKAGDKLYDAGRKHCASIRSDGTLKAFLRGGFHPSGRGGRSECAGVQRLGLLAF